MKKKFERSLVLLLTLTMVLSLSSMTALATDNASVSESEATAVPETTEEPEVTAEPETTEEPEVTAEPETTEEPEVTGEPETTVEPETTAVPETTAEPGAVEAVEAMLAALPDPEALAGMDEAGRTEAYDQVQAAYAAYMALCDEDKALLPEAEAVFAALFGWFNSQIVPLEAEEKKTVAYTGGEQEAIVLAADSAAWDGSGETGGWYEAEGSVTISGRVSVSGDVNLILADGCALTVTGGIGIQAGGKLTIWAQSGGTGALTATGAWALSGIGGAAGVDDFAVTINGGVINTTGGVYAAGIGGSANRGAGTILITGGTVTASADADGNHNGGAGIGTGWDNLHQNKAMGSVTINGGTVTASGAGVGTASGGAGIGTGKHFVGGVKVTITGGVVTASGGGGCYGIGAGLYSANSGGSTVITGGSVKASGGAGAIGRPAPTNGTDAVYLLTIPAEAGQTVTVDDHTYPHHGDGVYAYVTGAEHTVGVGGEKYDVSWDGSTFQFPEENVPYVDAGGAGHAAESANVVTAATTRMTDGWYVVKDAAVTANQRIEVTGDVDLILADGASLRAAGGIHVCMGNSLTIWAQSGGTGALSATGGAVWQAGIGGNNQEDGGAITINGGSVQASGRLYAAGIGGGA